VRLIWLKIPETNEIAVSYFVKVDERLKGTFMLDGKFSYIENNERKSVDINPVAINILPSTAIDPALIVDVNDFEKLTVPYPVSLPGDAANIACIRQKPQPGSQGDYVVNVLVSKKTTRSFAKIEEDVPAGYTAVAIDSKNAIFTFKDQKVKFLWMNLPMEPFFMVSYRLIPKNQAKLSAPVIKGAFSYLVEESTKSVDIIERDLNLAALTPENADAMIASALSEPEPEPVPARAVPFETAAIKETPAKAKPDTEKGVYYRIQLAAGHKSVNITRYFRKMNLEKEVIKEDHQGWKKYSIGSFSVYKDARDYRVHIWNTTPVKDAFITAYNDGQRITVQEALMITEQKWVR
jgi:hypothetical protein